MVAHEYSRARGLNICIMRGGSCGYYNLIIGDNFSSLGGTWVRIYREGRGRDPNRRDALSKKSDYASGRSSSRSTRRIRLHSGLRRQSVYCRYR